jgi:hypothetical protein
MGLSAFGGGLAIPITIVIAAGLLACDLALLSWKRLGSSLLAIILVLFMFTTFSAISNFNFFYTNYMRDRLAAERLDYASMKLANNIAQAEMVLNGELKPTTREQQIRQELRNLKNEINDITKGFGPRAQDHLNNIKKYLLPNKIAIMTLPPVGATKQKNNEVYDVIESRVPKH